MPYNPFAGVRISGGWDGHSSYSLGGTDLPLRSGSPIPAPASGTLRIKGGSGEFAAGWVGSAGLRSVFYLDEPIRRHTPASPKRMLGGYVEAEGPMVAIVLQHQSKQGTDGHHDEGVAIGFSGASADGKLVGGDTHLHWHGLDHAGRRLDITKFLPTTTAGSGSTPLSEEDDMPTAKEVSDEIMKAFLSDEPGSFGKQARDKIASAAADYVQTGVLINSGDGEGKGMRDTLGSTAADYVLAGLATATPGTIAGAAVERIAEAVRAKS